MITTILFDLDGTLLPMDQEAFVKSYLGRIAKKMAPHGYDPDTLVKAIWTGTGAMVQNTGRLTNEAVFWETFDSVLKKNSNADMALFMEFYQNDFQEIRHDCGFDARAAKALHEIQAMGYRTVLATNPIFPAVATQSRIRWAGLEPEDFSLVTTYENSSYCKPNPDYYREILGKLNLKAEECLMVGNDVDEDMVARTLGMRVFLLTDCIINRGGCDIFQYPHGSFPELLSYIRTL